MPILPNINTGDAVGPSKPSSLAANFSAQGSLPGMSHAFLSVGEGEKHLMRVDVTLKIHGWPS